jgi:hypothetical protein
MPNPSIYLNKRLNAVEFLGWLQAGSLAVALWSAPPTALWIVEELQSGRTFDWRLLIADCRFGVRRLDGAFDCIR